MDGREGGVKGGMEGGVEGRSCIWNCFAVSAELYSSSTGHLNSSGDSTYGHYIIGGLELNAQVLFLLSVCEMSVRCRMMQ